MTRSQLNIDACPLCGRTGQSRTRLLLADVEAAAGVRGARFATVICRDCALAMVARTAAAAAGQR